MTLLACSLPFILPARAWPAAQNGASDASRPATSNKTFRDPLGQGQDPSIEVIDGYYNLVQSSPDAHTITVRRSRSLKTLFDAKQSTVWRGGKKGTPCCDLWAPDIHNFNGKWYIYFAADGGQNINHRLYVIESDHARGPYHFKARLKTPGNKWAIDATAFKNSDGKLYLLWSGWPGDANRQQNIYLARLSNPWTVALNSPRTPLSAPTYDWETKGTLMGKTSDVRPNVNEGPAVLKHEKKIFVTFSASGCWTPNYKLGMLMANDDANLMDSRSWKKLPRPVFSSNSAAGVYGPGHNGFFKSPDGTEDWFVYHAVTDPHGNCGNERKVWAQKVRWRKGHTLPSFGKPIAPGTELKLPSGDEGLGNH